MAAQAARELLELTGKAAEGVTGLERTEDGWTVQVEVVEVRRIPDTTDVLALYEVETDDQGALQGYRRVRRYTRGSRERTEMTETHAARRPSRPYASAIGPTAGGPAPANLADILERVLDKGIIIAGDIRVNLLDIELLTIKIRLLIVSVDKAAGDGHRLVAQRPDAELQRSRSWPTRTASCASGSRSWRPGPGGGSDD